MGWRDSRWMMGRRRVREGTWRRECGKKWEERGGDIDGKYVRVIYSTGLKACTSWLI